MMATMAINNQHCDKLTSCSHLLFLCNSSVDLVVTILYQKKTLEGTFQLLLTNSLLLEKLQESFVERRKKFPVPHPNIIELNYEILRFGLIMLFFMSICARLGEK